MVKQKCTSFSLISAYLVCIFYCRCRHAQFAAYFGDDPPSCVNQCDVCTNPTKASQLLAGYRRVIYGVCTTNFFSLFNHFFGVKDISAESHMFFVAFRRVIDCLTINLVSKRASVASISNHNFGLSFLGVKYAYLTYILRPKCAKNVEKKAIVDVCMAYFPNFQKCVFGLVTVNRLSHTHTHADLNSKHQSS